MSGPPRESGTILGVERLAAGYGNKPKKIDAAALDYLKSLDWRGNIRELRNVVERLVIMSEDTISADDAKAFAGK